MNFEKKPEFTGISIKKKPRALDHNKDKIRTKEMDMLINSQFQLALTTRAVQPSSETQEEKTRK